MRVFSPVVIGASYAGCMRRGATRNRAGITTNSDRKSQPVVEVPTGIARDSRPRVETQPAVLRQARCQFVVDARARARIAEDRGPDLHRRGAPHRAGRSASRPRDAAHADDRKRARGAQAQTAASATGFSAGPSSPPVAGAEQRAPVQRFDRHAAECVHAASARRRRRPRRPGRARRRRPRSARASPSSGRDVRARDTRGRRPSVSARVGADRDAAGLDVRARRCSARARRPRRARSSALGQADVVVDARSRRPRRRAGRRRARRASGRPRDERVDARVRRARSS